MLMWGSPWQSMVERGPRAARSGHTPVVRAVRVTFNGREILLPPRCHSLAIAKGCTATVTNVPRLSKQPPHALRQHETRGAAGCGTGEKCGARHFSEGLS